MKILSGSRSAAQYLSIVISDWTIILYHDFFLISKHCSYSNIYCLYVHITNSSYVPFMITIVIYIKLMHLLTLNVSQYI